MVKYAPRKVYIRESGGYVELSYTEFCRCRESDQTYMDKLFIPIQGCLLEVVREQYTDFYRDKERWRYLQKLDTKNRLLSLDGFTDSEGNPLDFITDEAVDIAETVVNAVMVDRLKAALPLLSDSEQELIQAIFFDGLSEREVGARLGITQSVVNKHGREDRKWRIWKEAEEKLLRECGVDEATIEQIRMADRADFNSNRRFYRWTNDVAEYLEDMAGRERQAEVGTVAELLEEIESENLYQVLVTVDGRTLKIVLLKMQGYSTKEIAPLVHLTTGAIYARLDHLRKKLRKIL